MNFIECNRKGGGKVRIRADAITAVVEAKIKGEKGYVLQLQVQIGNANIVVEDETLDSLWNKMAQARNLQHLPVYVTAQPDREPEMVEVQAA